MIDYLERLVFLVLRVQINIRNKAMGGCYIREKIVDYLSFNRLFPISLLFFMSEIGSVDMDKD